MAGTAAIVESRARFLTSLQKVLLIVDTGDTQSPELLVAPHRDHEAVEGAHHGEYDQSDEPRADGDQLLCTAAERISTTTLLAVCLGDFSVYFRSLDCKGSYVFVIFQITYYCE